MVKIKESYLLFYKSGEGGEPPHQKKSGGISAPLLPPPMMQMKNAKSRNLAATGTIQHKFS